VAIEIEVPGDLSHVADLVDQADGICFLLRVK